MGDSEKTIRFITYLGLAGTLHVGTTGLRPSDQQGDYWDTMRF